MLGEFLGSGSTRDVFVYSKDPNYVVKVLNAKGRNRRNDDANKREYENGRRLAKLWPGWIARCWLKGKYLIMERTKPIESRFERPRFVPECFTDISPAQWGYLFRNGNLVLHDYHILKKTVTNKMKELPITHQVVEQRNKRYGTSKRHKGGACCC